MPGRCTRLRFEEHMKLSYLCVRTLQTKTKKSSFQVKDNVAVFMQCLQNIGIALCGLILLFRVLCLGPFIS